jgi:hypothetical protein
VARPRSKRTRILAPGRGQIGAGPGYDRLEVHLAVHGPVGDPQEPLDLLLQVEGLVGVIER